MTYTTILGDTWDGIAYKLYGSETSMTELIAANQSYVEMVIFSAGTVLNVPDLPTGLADSASSLPPWKRGGSS